MLISGMNEKLFIHYFSHTLSDRSSSKIIHLHGNRKVLKVVEKLEEGSELIKGNSLKKKHVAM